MKWPQRRAGPTALLLSFFLAVGTVLPAQEKAAVGCDVLVGFNGVVREGRFAPVIVSLDNPRGTIDAEVRVEVTWGSGLRGTQGARVFTRNAHLAGQGTRRFSFLVPIPADARMLVARVSSAGAELARQDIDLRPMTTAGRLIAGISSDLSLDGLAAVSGGASRVVYPRMDDLPETWAGYDGIDMVVVHDASFQQARTVQIEALERWVVTGGVLVFTGGPSALQLSSAGFGPLMPVEVTGIAETRGLASLAGFSGWSPGPAAGAVIVRTRVTGGTVRAAEGPRALLVQRRLGSGSIWFMAFDPTLPPLNAWPGLPRLWRAIDASDRKPTLGAAPREVFDDPWMQALVDTSALSFPSLPAVLAFAACVIALICLVVAERPLRGLGPRLRLLLLAGIGASACLAGWLLFNHALFRPGPRVLEAARITCRSGDGLALVTEKIAVVTASPATAELRIGSRDAAVEEAGGREPAASGRGADPREEVAVAGGRTSIRGLRLGRMGSRLVVVHDVIPMRVSAHAALQGTLLRVTVSNGEPVGLRGCFLWRAGRRYPIGDIPPRGSVERSFDESEGIETGPAGFFDSDGDARRARLWRLEEESGNRDPSSVVMAGWREGSGLLLSLPGARTAGDRPGLSLLLVEAQ